MLPCVAVSCIAMPCVAVCCCVLQCCVLQCVAVCCSVFQCRMLQYVAVCCRVLQGRVRQRVYLVKLLVFIHIFIAACRVLQCRVLQCRALQCAAVCCSVVCCKVLQCVAVCCSVACCSVLLCRVSQYRVSQYIAVCGSVLQCVANVAVFCSVVCCIVVCCSVLQSLPRQTPCLHPYPHRRLPGPRHRHRCTIQYTHVSCLRIFSIRGEVLSLQAHHSDVIHELHHATNYISEISRALHKHNACVFVRVCLYVRHIKRPYLCRSPS